MGISYTAAKVAVPEAWDIGKDYYALTDVFPACATTLFEGVAGLIARMAVPKVKDLPHLVGSRHIVGNAVFAVTDYYKSADEMIAKIVELKQRALDPQTDINLRGFYHWAGSDSIQFIGEAYDLEEREAADEYQLCTNARAYIVMNSWNGEAGRSMIEDFEEE